MPKTPIKLEPSKQGIFFTSDTHFGHQNILKFCKRPWDTVEEMNEALIANWNAVVKEDDIVFHLGDFAFGGSALWNEVLSKLKGHIHLIIGNHDEHNLRQGFMNKFESVSYQKKILIEGRQIYLNHYPFLCYGGSYRSPENAVWQLFGHVHSGPNSTGKDTERLVNLFPYQYDVGVDNNNYAPISWEQVKEIIDNQVKSVIENSSK